MRRLLLWTILLLVLLVGGIVIGANVWGKPEAMLLAGVPALPILPLLLVYLLLAAYSANKERYQGMRDAAEQLGFLYTADISDSLVKETAGFHLTAGRTQLSNEIRGEQDGVPAVVFTCGVRSSDQGHRYVAAVLLPLHAMHVPDFMLTPKTVVDRLGQAMSGQVIEFDGSQQRESFSRQYAIRLRGESTEDDLHAFFDESRMRSLAVRDALSIEVLGGSMLVWHEVGVREGLRQACRSIRVNVADEAVGVLQQAMEIRAAMLK